jgi:hypothetical protein
MQELVCTGAGPATGDVSRIERAWTRAGEARTLVLVDDGTQPHDSPWDGIWTATDAGAFVRDVNARIVMKDLSGTEYVLFTGLVHPGDDRSAVLSWQVRRTGTGYAAAPVVSAWPGAAAALPDATHVYVGAGWACVVVVLAAGLAHAARRRGIGW